MTDVAKDTMPEMVKLAREIEGMTSDVIGYGMVSHLMTYSRDELRRAMLCFPLSAEWLLDSS